MVIDLMKQSPRSTPGAGLENGNALQLLILVADPDRAEQLAANSPPPCARRDLPCRRGMRKIPAR
jgi:hypothetical protein